ncbi:hypothetical protein CHS0354_040029 [Potamilus streckersoni]|uniref:CCD97-like C-terminal domain-containing protein n=1 Tax=Potamilus streckersoni TaxID=2493646 RepID=A0AAE0W1H1_9BIVA|nr:hypothetical protein CHS0354_040029 [Potamilus streckersoni]
MNFTDVSTEQANSSEQLNRIAENGASVAEVGRLTMNEDSNIEAEKETALEFTAMSVSATDFVDQSDRLAAHSSSSMPTESVFENDNLDTEHGNEAGMDCSCESAQQSMKSCDSVHAMLAHLAQSDAHFKHQQLGEPDLTVKEKYIIAQDIYNSSRVRFLTRFHSYLEYEDLQCFEDLKGTYEVDFYAREIQKRKNEAYRTNRIKNRRYEAMKQLTLQGEYFSEEEMKYRDPYLYEHMVGQYLTDQEIRQTIDKSDLRFSSILLKHIDQQVENAVYEYSKNNEEGQEEETEESEEDEEEEEEEEDENGKRKISHQAKEMLKNEFLTIMQEKFLRGEDRNFDYSKVDDNEEYDDMCIVDREEEEKYFDDEEPVKIDDDETMCT